MGQPDESDELIGEPLFGGYKVTKQIGEGGMGAVYLVENAELNRKLAVKILLPERSSNSQMTARFLAEARAASAIHHRNIIDIIDSSQLPDGRHYILMEYLNGRTLRRFARKYGPLRISQVLSIMGQVCSGLHATHNRGIVHRDLKPSNIFVAPEPDNKYFTKILDFGIAKLDDPLLAGEVKTKSQAIAGTPHYMSPEQARALRDVDHRADVYSVGAIVYELLTGKVPYNAHSIGELVFQQTRTIPKMPHEIRGAIPIEWSELVMRAISIDIDKRTKSIQTLATEMIEATPEGNEIARRHAPLLFAGTRAPSVSRMENLADLAPSFVSAASAASAMSGEEVTNENIVRGQDNGLSLRMETPRSAVDHSGGLPTFPTADERKTPSPKKAAKEVNSANWKVEKGPADSGVAIENRLLHSDQRAGTTAVSGLSVSRKNQQKTDHQADSSDDGLERAETLLSQPVDSIDALMNLAKEDSAIDIAQISVSKHARSASTDPTRSVTLETAQLVRRNSKGKYLALVVVAVLAGIAFATFLTKWGAAVTTKSAVPTVINNTEVITDQHIAEAGSRSNTKSENKQPQLGEKKNGISPAEQETKTTEPTTETVVQKPTTMTTVDAADKVGATPDVSQRIERTPVDAKGAKKPSRKTTVPKASNNNSPPKDTPSSPGLDDLTLTPMLLD